MNERRLKQLNILVLITAFVGLVFIGLFVFVFAPDNDNRIESGRLTEFNDGWILRGYRGEADSLIELPDKIKADTGEILLIMHQVPEDVTKDSVLLLETEFQNVVVMVGDERVYMNGILNNQKLMKNAVPCYNMIDIGSAEPGEVISIYVSSAYKKYSGSLGSVYYGTKGDVVAEIVRKNGAGFIFGITLLVITIILSISLIFMRNVNVDKRKSAYAFGFIFVTSLWSITGNPIMQLLTNNNFGVYMSNMVLLLIMPILYIMHQRCFAIKRRYAKIFEIGIYVFSINFLTGVIFQMLGVADFATYIIFTKVLITIGLILLSGIMYLAIETYSDKTIYSNLWANVVLTAACLLEALLSIFRFYSKYDGVVLQVGVYIFMVLLVIATEKSIIREMTHQRDVALNSIEREKSMAVRNINTAFIYSSLNTAINSLKSNNLEDSRLIYNTSIYMKYNMQAVNEKNLVPFSQELEYIRAYLDIQKRVNAQLDVNIEDKIVEFMIPFNTVEPLVENAVINGALKAEAGRIVVRSYERLDCYAIQIVDNGKGIGPDKRFVGKQSYKSIKKRLKTMCGAVIEVRNKPDKGTIVTVKIPKDGYVVKE